MSLLWVAVFLNTFIIERIKYEEKSIVRWSRKESKNWARGSVIELYWESGCKTKVITMFMNLGPLEKALHGVNWRSPQSVGHSQKVKNHLIFGHSPQKLTTGVVRMLYPQDTKHIGYQLQCDNYVCTSNASMKERYWRIKSLHVRVKLLDQHGWTCDCNVTQWLLTSTVNDSG